MKYLRTVKLIAIDILSVYLYSAVSMCKIQEEALSTQANLITFQSDAISKRIFTPLFTNTNKLVDIKH